MVDWVAVSGRLEQIAADPLFGWQHGQDEALRWLAATLQERRGALIADEVGLGKTRVALAVVHAVEAAGGRVAVVVPPTLFHQWEAEYRQLLSLVGGPEKRPKRLRGFLDAFPEDAPSQRKGPYPLLSGASPFLLISHGFGLAGRIGAGVRRYAVALPFIVRSFQKAGVGNWTHARGLKSEMEEDARIRRQIPAAQWLAARTRDLKKDLEDLPPLSKNVGESFSVDPSGDGPERRRLSRNLLGRLLGTVDLLVIDEAHRSRELGEEEARLTKRLSFLLEEVLRTSREHRRLALTATPVQLSQDDWRGTLRRIGLQHAEVDQRMGSIREFERVRDELRVGPASEEDVRRLCDAAGQFEAALGDVMTRRRWADHPDIHEARRILCRDGAHPHRRWDEPPASMSWSALPVEQRVNMLAAEGRSLAATGTSLALVERHGARRLGQALSLGNEAAQEWTRPVHDGSEDRQEGGREADGPLRDAVRRERHAYWSGLQVVVQPRADGFRDEEKLVVHPRVLAACNWVEDVTRRGEKVLVFGAYRRALTALTTLLNVRRFLREVAGQLPTRAPRQLWDRDLATDPLVRAVLAQMPDRHTVGAAEGLTEMAQRCAGAYDRRTDRLTELLRPILEEASLRGIEADALARVLRLSLIEQVLEGESIDQVRRDAQRLLQRLLGANIADELDEDGTDGGALLQALELEAAHVDSGSKAYEVRRSDFARTLDGSSSASTRHVLQALFNEPRMRPRVLVAQSRVGAEGLNLHEACRHVLMLHLDWNPAVIEQQIGRVDRLQSL